MAIKSNGVWKAPGELFREDSSSNHYRIAFEHFSNEAKIENFFLEKKYSPQQKALRNLAWAVLCESILDLNVKKTSSGRTKSTYASAKKWFTENDYESPFSFVSICELLGLSIEKVRAAVNSGSISKGWISPRFFRSRGG